jgi:hypothetical protein
MIKSTFSLFRLIAFELVIAGIISAVIAGTQKYESALAISLVTILAGGICFWFADMTRSKPIIVDGIESFISSRYGRYVLFVPVVLLSVFLFAFEPRGNLVIALAPVLLCLWLIGLELIWFFPVRWDATPQNPQRNWLSFFALLLVYGFLLIPAHIPSLLDGVLWNQKFEFMAAMLFIPIAFIINWSFFAKRRITVVLLGLLLIKLLISSFIPQSGLGVRVFKDADAFAAGVWEKSYQTWLSPAYTDVMQSPYHSMRELPVDWVNNRFGFDFDQFWMTLQLDGTIRIPDDGRFVLLVRGASQTQLELVDLKSHLKTSATVVENAKSLDKNLYIQLPESKSFNLHGVILYKRFGEARLEPLIMYPDGSTKSVFENAGVWLSSENIIMQSQVVFFRSVLDFFSLILIGIISLGFLLGLADLLSKNKLSNADLYLALTSCMAYYIADLIPKQQLSFFVIGLLFVILIVKFFDYKFSPSEPSFRSFLVLAGIIFLAAFITLDISGLRAMSIFPPAQDGLEYQTFGRYIFAYGDIFLAQTPPRAYKILFPYLVGLLHLLFGQSVSAQLFLNAWCAILSSGLTFQLARFFKLPSKFALTVSILLPLILCLPASFIYYYRFGLIEPVAILCLLATMYFAATQNLAWMFFTGILTVLFRLDYLGVTFAAILLTAPSMTGTAQQVWKLLLDWGIKKWKLIAVYMVSLVTPPLVIVFGYFLLIPNYMLNASDTHQSSPQTVLESVSRVVIGGTPFEIFTKFTANPLDTLLIVIPLAGGFIIALASLLFRKGIFSKLDLRLGLLIPAILPAYVVVRPAAYFPRFSFSLLPLDLIMIGLLVYFSSSKVSQNHTTPIVSHLIEKEKPA